MENSDKNVLMLLALELDLDSLMNLCLSKKKFNELICKNNTFWMNRLFKEYPNFKGKFPPTSDYKRIYTSLINKEIYEYNVFISSCDSEDQDQDQPPKFWDYIKVIEKDKSNYNNLNDDDVELAKKIYPDFDVRCGEDFSFDVLGDFPKGTKIYLVYSTDSDMEIKYSFISKEDARKKILQLLEWLIEDDIIVIGEMNNKNILDFYKYNNVTDIVNDYMKTIDKQGYIKLHDNNTDKDYFLILREFTLIDYAKILKELKEKNPNWKKLPKDVINYILSYLK